MRPIVPDGVGPHAERELDLMLAGTKPAAMFSEAEQFRDIIPEAHFEPHVRSGRIIKKVIYSTNPRDGIPFVHVYFALPGEEWRIDALHELETDIQNRRCRSTDEHDRAIGKLLGYLDADIESYLRWTREWCSEERAVGR